MHNNCRANTLQRYRVRQHRRAIHAYEFFNALTGPELLDVVDSHLPSHRERLFPPTTTLSLFMAQTLNPDASCQATIDRHAVERMAQGLSACSTATGAYCKARQRLPADMVQALLRHTGKVLIDEAAPWRWKGRPVKLVDGTTVTMPDTPANQARYPQPDSQKPGLGSPIARVLALTCLETGAVLDTAFGPYAGKGASENALFHTMLPDLTEGDIVMGDAYYSSYAMVALLQARGIDSVLQQQGSRATDFRRGQRLGSRDHVVTWHKPRQRPPWLTPEQYAEIPDTLRMREVKTDSKVLVTTLVSKDQARAKELKELYVRRWNIELNLRDIKSTLGLDRLTCHTPAMNEKQWRVGLLAYNMIRLLMVHSAAHADVLPRQLSFKHSLQLWLAWSHHGLPMNSTQIEYLLALIAQRLIGQRPGRTEPRAVKRRPKPFPRLAQPRATARDQLRKRHATG